MGDFRVRPIKDKSDRDYMYQHAINDISAFEYMLRNGLLTKSHPKIGAEQELCIVDDHCNPSKSALDILDKVNHEQYTNELGLYNLEINLDPEDLSRKCFSTIETKLTDLIQIGNSKAKELNQHFLLAGILPTLRIKHLDFEYMTPIPRYKTLSNVLRDIRGDHFEIYLQGVDDLMASLESVLFEACNTSFQLHLQINPDEFVERFNWSQMIAGPVLAACTNSPILLGRELWAESRIALFKQSLDTRSSKNHLRKKLPRVYFGNNWLKGSPAELWKNELMRFPLILTSDNFEDSNLTLKNGGSPDLRAIRLHNGTTYTWNRLCYGGAKHPHIRIECRYLPAGPTIIDEVANFVFWIGLMCAMPNTWKTDINTISFKSVKGNFIRSARNGLNTVVQWYDKNVAVSKLILDELLPMAYQGLKKYNIEQDDIDKYLGVIHDRVLKEQNGSSWMIEQYRTYTKQKNSYFAGKALVEQMIQYQKANIPVHQWRLHQSPVSSTCLTDNEDIITAGELMSTDIFTVNEETSLSLVRSIMKWRNIHHLPVENNSGDLVGIITDGMIKALPIAEDNTLYAEDIMERKVISVDRDISITELRKLLTEKDLFGVPVVRHSKLIGLITTNDLLPS